MRSCCCCSSKTGTCIIAVVYMVTEFMSTKFFEYFRFNMDCTSCSLLSYLSDWEFRMPITTCTLYRSCKPLMKWLLIQPLQLWTSYSTVNIVGAKMFKHSNWAYPIILIPTAVKSILVGALIFKGVFFIVCLLLFVGACKEAAGYLMPWIIIEFIRQLLFFAAFVAVSWFISLLVQADEVNSTVLPLFCILLILIICKKFTQHIHNFTQYTRLHRPTVLLLAGCRRSISSLSRARSHPSFKWIPDGSFAWT